MHGRQLCSLIFVLCALAGLAAPARAHDPALSGIRILYRKGDVVVCVMTHLSRLKLAEKCVSTSMTTVEIDTAIRRRLHLHFGNAALIPTTGTVIEDIGSDYLSWQTVISTPEGRCLATSRLYEEDPASSTVVSVVRDGQAVEETLLDAAHPDMSGQRPAEVNNRDPQNSLSRTLAAHQITPWAALAVFGLAFLFGALHALSPGHGKTVVAAYLVGSRGTVRHAILLGAVVTLTHTAGVFALGLLTLSAEQFFVPERLYPILSVLSGGTVACVGLGLMWCQSRAPADKSERAGRGEDLDGDGASVLPDSASVSMRRLIALGMSGGALPCPSALVVMLSAIAMHRLALGLALIIAFSLGLSVVLIGLGLLAIRFSGALERLPVSRRLLGRLPTISAAAVALLGLLMVFQALSGRGF